MIYLFMGDDTGRKLMSYEQFIDDTPKENEIFYINKNDLDPQQLESFYSGAGLFFTKCVVVLSGILEREETRRLILDNIERMSTSGNSFVLLEGELSKPILDRFQKARAECNIFELPKAKKEKFNNFLVANAFGAKNKFNMWLHFRQAMDLGVGMEEIVGVLFWKIKDMLLKKDFHKFTEDELKDSATRLSYLLPKARKQGQDAEASLEQFLLQAF